MPKAENLTGRAFGFLEVLGQEPDKVTPSGQKCKMWRCQCHLCGRIKSVGGSDLKSGRAVSCGCYRVKKMRAARNKKTCVICGHKFECPPSSKKVTCSKECQKIRAAKSASHKRTEETRRKIAASAKGRDMSAIQPAAIAAAKSSPKSGRYETNINAMDWHLVSPEGRHYHFHSLNFWLRENCRGLFGCEPDSREFANARSGLSGAKRATLGKRHPSCTYKGWQVIPTEDDYVKINQSDNV